MNLSSVLTFVLIAIAALALMVPGLDALYSSIEHLQDVKGKEAIERCYAIVAQQKSYAQEECEEREVSKARATFTPALEMISAARAALNLEAASAASAASNASASSGT